MKAKPCDDGSTSLPTIVFHYYGLSEQTPPGHPAAQAALKRPRRPGCRWNVWLQIAANLGLIGGLVLVAVQSHRLGVDRVGIYASSSAGPPAIAYTARHPDRVSRLVLAATFASTAWMSTERRELLDKLLPLMRSSWEQPEVRNMVVDLIAPEIDGVERRLAGEFMRRSGDGPAVAGFISEHFLHDVEDLARQITVPTLVIQGRDDQLFSVEAARTLAATCARDPSCNRSRPPKRASTSAVWRSGSTRRVEKRAGPVSAPATRSASLYCADPGRTECAARDLQPRGATGARSLALEGSP